MSDSDFSDGSDFGDHGRSRTLGNHSPAFDDDDDDDAFGISQSRSRNGASGPGGAHAGGNATGPGDSRQQRTADLGVSQKIQNQHFDEAFDVSDEEKEDSPPAASRHNSQKSAPAAGSSSAASSSAMNAQRMRATQDTQPTGNYRGQSADDGFDEDQDQDAGLDDDGEGEGEDDMHSGHNLSDTKLSSESDSGTMHLSRTGPGFGSRNLGRGGADEDDDGADEDEDGQEGMLMEGNTGGESIHTVLSYVSAFQPTELELETKLKPFLPEYIPSIGDIDAFIKVPRPDGKPDNLGLVSLDEPAAKQSDPTILDLQLRAMSKTSGMQPAVVRSIENAEKNPKAVATWIDNVAALHLQKPKATVSYNKPMPDMDDLMQVWPSEFEEYLSRFPLPDSDIALDLEEFARLVCAVVDVPVYGKLIDSLHMVFSLYAEFKSNQHFQAQ